MMSIIKIVFSVIGFVLLLNFLTPQFDFLLKRSIKNQISYLEDKFEKRLGNQLQKQYPEGELFSNLIFALSIIEYSEYKNGLSPEIVEKLIFTSVSDEAKLNYRKNLPLPYGAFYNGWINYTLKKYIESDLIKNSINKERVFELYQEISDRIVLSQSESVQLLETYPNSIWPADNMVCIASLDKTHEHLKREWLTKIRQQSKDTLINHYGRNLGEIRGSSQALINYFLIEIDSTSAKNAHQEYKERFEDRILGISFIKEYESYENAPDIDSGPIILGYGSVSTIMNSKLKSRLKEKGYATTFGFLNTLGLPINLFGKKYYLFGQEPMFDIFMLWNSVGILKKQVNKELIFRDERDTDKLPINSFYSGSVCAI